MSSSDNLGVQLPSSSRPSPSPRSPQGRRRPPPQPQTNADAKPTIRIVGDSDPKTAYDKSPFPSQPSQILSPSRYDQGSHINDQGHGVSGNDSPANRPRAVSQRVASMVANFEALTPKALEPRSSNRNSSSTKNSRNSAASTLTLGAPFTPASSRFSQGTTPPTSPLSNLRQSKHDSLASTNILSAFEDEEDQATTPTAPSAPAGLGSPAPIAPSAPGGLGSPAPIAPAAATIRPVIPSGSYPEPTKFSQDTEPENEFARPVYPSASTALTESIRRPSEASTADCNRTHRTSDTPTPPSSAANGSWLSRAWESLSIASDDTAIYRKPAGQRDFSGSTIERRPIPEPEPHTSSSSSPGQLSEFSAPSSQKTTVHHPRSRSDHLGSTRVSDESLYSLPSTRGSNNHSRSSSSPAPNWSLHPALETDENGSPVSSTGRRPSSSSPWGESRPLPKNKTRMQERSANWSSQLSTIDSASEPRTSQSLSTGHRKRQSLGSIDYLTSAAEPAPSSRDQTNPATPRLIIPSETQTWRDREHHGEGDDTLGELNVLPLRPQRSGLLRTLSLDSSRPSSSHSARSSYTTHFLDTVPAWAREYYRNGLGERSSFFTSSSSDLSSPHLSRANTVASGSANSRSPTEYNFQQSVWRPRNRPSHHQGGRGSPANRTRKHHRNNSSQPSIPFSELSYQPATRTSTQRSPEMGRSAEDLHTAPPPVPAKNTPNPNTHDNNRMSVRDENSKLPQTRQSMRSSLIPRLRPANRRSTARLSVWTVPSISEPLGTLFFGAHNRQLLLFCVGFAVPLAWMLAAVLPLPPRPAAQESDLEKGKARPPSSDVQGVLRAKEEAAERATAEKRWRKADWWRRLNRWMSIVGVVVIAVVVVVVAVVETK